MVRETKIERLPPYVSYATWSKLINALANFLPDVIDGSVYDQMRFSGSDRKKLKTALRYLNLVGETGTPEPKLRELVVACEDGDRSKADVLKEILKEAYPFISDGSFNLASASWKQLTDRFEALGATGSVQQQCISYFLHMAAEAELEISPHLSSRSRSGLGRPSAVKKTRRKQKKKPEEPQTDNPPPPGSGDSDEATGTLGIDPTVAGILRLLPRSGETWDQEGKKRFLVALEAVLNAVYPDEDTSSG